ncbi:site-specific DNA-methyltransferase [Aquiflexum gelatinilyticum]|uniref:site-specific DNA-methyltransferase (adenine-specific) n=1 Tax=Aquiflexum gelatinilyticum TaxID=2961943 RepID=A0A9X2SZ00_9BACT|nr:site-specific DNA-methyltransferase [Aquiflexum gelatinilyticum]MCR9015829.1 site-specific DNA-methyltransferase [Aquiflexum gelatinilyticum]
MEGTSLTPQQEKVNALREILPEVFSEGKVDWEKLKATLGENINFSNERYVLNWAGKSDAFKVLQTPSTKTLIPAKDESINFDQTQNIFIEGENLEVLKVLQKSYFGKVKMIYIDPPYNTGNDSFVYPDKFSESKADYEKRVGDKDEEGFLTKDGMFKKNNKENGQYHSNWLNMMMPRLYLAKNLLRKDGVIFVSIDDNEVHNLRLLMNEIFGEENFVEEIIWKNKYNSGALTKGFSNIHEYILCFSKQELINIESPLDEETIKKYNKVDDKFQIRGGFVTQPLATGSKDERPNLRYPIEYNGTVIWPEKQWIWSRERVEKAIKNNEVVFNQAGDSYNPRVKQYLRDEKGKIRKGKPISILVGPYNQEGSKEIKNLFSENVFGFPKPSSLIKYLMSFTTNDIEETDGIYLDFFSGSGTTAHAIMDLNKEDGGARKYICVQLPELTDERSEAFKAGYKTIADISKERIRRSAQKIKEEIDTEIKKLYSEIQKLLGELPTDETLEKISNLESQISKLENQDLGFKVMKLEESNFKQWQQIEGHDVKALAEQIKMFVDPVSESAIIENMVYELLLKSGKDLNSTILEKEGYFVINDYELILILEKVNQDILDEVLTLKPIKVIALDRLFKGNDQLKTNAVLQMRDAGVEFKTI